MIKISLTDFVDFVISSGTPKLTKVRQLKKRGKYEPVFDFWKKFRDSIIQFHEAGGTDKKQLDAILEEISDEKKIGRYTICLKGYKRFLGSKKYRWFEPPYNTWGQKGFAIRVNPELGLIIDKKVYVVKLYFKAEPLTKRKIEIILLLLYEALKRRIKKQANLSILDVQRGKIYSSSSPSREILPLLRGEAQGFETIWKQIR